MPSADVKDTCISAFGVGRSDCHSRVSPALEHSDVLSGRSYHAVPLSALEISQPRTQHTCWVPKARHCQKWDPCSITNATNNQYISLCNLRSAIETYTHVWLKRTRGQSLFLKSWRMTSILNSSSTKHPHLYLPQLCFHKNRSIGWKLKIFFDVAAIGIVHRTTLTLPELAIRYVDANCNFDRSSACKRFALLLMVQLSLMINYRHW